LFLATSSVVRASAGLSQLYTLEMKVKAALIEREAK
jgi:hypothetical protein